jgi:formylglycine-generating enzyme required for sulfatase activity
MLKTTIALLLALAPLALTGCEELMSKPQPAATPVGPEGGSAGAPGAQPTAPVQPPGTAPPMFGIINHLSKWDNASSQQRREIAEYIASKDGGIVFKGLQAFSSGGQSHEIAVFVHEKAGLEFSLIPGGEFEMGSPKREKKRKSDEKQHRVRISKAFLLARTEATQKNYRAVGLTDPSDAKGDDLPVQMVSSIAASKFTRKCRGFIPTEAEWEWACRAGTTTAYNFGKSEKDLDGYAWTSKNAGGSIHPVAQKKPNAFGLYDMHGNVWEWTKGGAGEYPDGPVTDPKGDEGTQHMAVRGGSFATMPPTARSAFRMPTHPSDKNNALGIRVAKVIRAK